MELLAPYRTEIDGRRRALQPIADAMGIPVEELWRGITDEWDTAGTMRAAWLPRAFREGRTLYTLRFPGGWWVDISAMESLRALRELFPSPSPTETGTFDGPLTLSHLTGEDRVLTTSIAAALRDEITLDDGTLPLGIRFLSKHGQPSAGSGVCWAYWMRDVDSGLGEPTEVDPGASISEDDPDLVVVQSFCKIRTR